MGMSGMYGPADETESIATIHAALERGVTLIDTGDFYGMGHNEMLIGRALRDRRDRALLSVKFGALRAPDGSWIGFDARPAAVKNFLAYSLTRLGVDHIDIYRPARLDPAVPIEDTVGAIADLVKAGYVRAIGLSEVGADTIRRAHAVHPIADLQIEYSLLSRGPEAKIFPAARGARHRRHRLRRAVARAADRRAGPTAPGDFRAYLPRFSGENRGATSALVDALRAAGRASKGVTRRAARHRLGAGQGRAHRAGHRRAHPARSSTTRWRRCDSTLSPASSRASRRRVPAAAVAGDRYDEHADAHARQRTLTVGRQTSEAPAGRTYNPSWISDPCVLGLAVLVVVAAAAGAVPLSSQTRSLPDAPGTWKPWKPFTATAAPRQQQAATPALVKAFEAELLALNAIRAGHRRSRPRRLQRRNLGQPGVIPCARPGARTAGRLPLAGGLTFGAFPIFEYHADGKTVREDTGETALQLFLVNQIGSGVIDRGNVPDWGAGRSRRVRAADAQRRDCRPAALR